MKKTKGERKGWPEIKDPVVMGKFITEKGGAPPIDLKKIEPEELEMTRNKAYNYLVP
jgi:hypothetical protein